MKVLKISTLIAAMTAITGAHASGLEVSTQSIAPLFESGNYAEASYVYIKPKITGKDALNNPIGDMLDDYGYVGGAVKVAPTPDTALMLTYTQPWGVYTTYPEGNMYNNALGTTKADVTGKALGIVAGGKVGAKKNVWLYGGVEHQKLSGAISAATPVGMENALTLAGNDPNVAAAIAQLPSYYDLQFKDSTVLIPMVGMAYEKPEIALRAALTYRAPANFRVTGTETVTAAVPNVQTIVPAYNSRDTVTFPQSVSIDFQTGLSQKHQLLGSVNARWVDWSQFNVSPPVAYNLNGEPLAYYTKDQYSVEVALAKQMTPKFAGELRLGYDTGTGEPLGLLGPYGAIKSVGLGGHYKPVENLAISAGVQYATLDGGKSYKKDGTPLATIDDGHALAFGTKIAYSF